MTINFLSILIVFPLFAAVLLAFLPRGNDLGIKRFALGAALVELVFSVFMLLNFNPASQAMQFVEQYTWLPQFGISYHVGVDGISIWLVLLTTFLMVIAIPASFNYIRDRLKEYYILFLVLESAVLGVFLSLDLFLFYVFWEFTLIPMAFIIGIWGHERRVYAAVKFILFTMTGSLLMLVAIIVLAFSHNPVSFDWNVLRQGGGLAPGIEPWLFGAFALAFAIKVPMWPLHTWLPDAHVQAPTAGSIILAGLLLKLGAYGFLRFNLTLFPNAAHQFAPVLAVLAIIGIIYGAAVAAMQRDLKSLVAYSSVSHMGFIILGIFAFNLTAASGAVIQMVNHGLSTGALFLIVGMIDERRHTRLIAEFGGLAKVMPILAAFFLVVMLSSMGLPGLNGFVGEFLILLGAWSASPVYTILAATGMILAAIYLLWMYERVMQGQVTNERNLGLPDLSTREIGLLVALVVFIIVLGVYPRLVLDPMQASLANLLNIANSATGLVQ